MPKAIPEDWTKKRFGAVLLGRGTRNGIYKPKKFHGTGVKIVNMGELFANRRLKPISMKRIQLNEKEKNKFLLKEGDLLFARRSLVAEGAGQCSLVHSLDEPTTFESSIIRARPSPDLADSTYLFYLFRSRTGRHLLKSIRRQTSVSGIAGSDLVELEIPLPPIYEQRAIARILTLFDEKIDLNREVNRLLESLAQAIFKSWFVEFDPVVARAAGRRPLGMSDEIASLFPDRFMDSPIGSIPRGWEVTSIPEFFEVNPRRSLNSDQLAPYLSMQNTPTDSPMPEKWRFRKYGTGMRFMNGDTLIAKITPCLENGKTTYVQFLEEGQIGWGSTEFIVLRSPSGIPLELSYFLAKDAQFRAFAIANMTGSSGRQRVPVRSLEHYEFAVPPKNLLFEFGRISRPIMAKIFANIQEIRTLGVMRDALLPKLLSGEIRVAEAEEAAQAVNA